jgi:hypothetical protein
MAGTGGKRPGAGRPKGSKSRFGKTPTGQALAVTADAIRPRGKSIFAPATAPKGIEPKDLMLANMRGAWEAAHRNAREADELEVALEVLEPEARKAAVEKIAALRVEAGRHVTLAQAAAKDVAPFCHPRLANVDTTVAGGITVLVKQYGPAAPKVADVKHDGGIAVTIK